MSELTISSNLQVMGVINTTPDSFSDGGRFDTTDKAFAHARQLIAEGVDILDIGGESTRPGSQQVDLEQELARTIPLIKLIREISDVPISIDTNKPGVMQAAVNAGATMINSIWAPKPCSKIQSTRILSARLWIFSRHEWMPRSMQG
jgi:dihydropteroate synthase